MGRPPGQTLIPEAEQAPGRDIDRISLAPLGSRSTAVRVAGERVRIENCLQADGVQHLGTQH
ncbi:hypothetical protein [Glutamicibacter sp. NPDC087344]|uniref:hypothetical protein n=1 Tax=Glutamicibacter sp. NPDC087344 TaxID=3363994 RepID=UPI00380D6079